MTLYLNMSGYVGLCRGLSGFSRFVEPGGYDMPCVCAHVCVFVGVCRGFSGFVEPGGYMMPAFVIVNCTLYSVPSKCFLSLKIFKNI